jgi:1,4-dihydroxy-2-naphthoate octaprenyltransferase
MNISMWWKALQVIPRISKEEWDRLDVISRWLVATRAAVLIMTFLSAAIAGILALRDGGFDLLKWFLVTVGLCLAHATNNLLNDYVDYVRGVDQENTYRSQYGPQPLVHGLMSKAELLRYALGTGLVAVAAGVELIVQRGGLTPLLMALGAFFVLFYTWPLKYIALGELSVLLVWGPLMIGGGYYVITGAWNWQVVVASLPYALGVTGVIMGKHAARPARGNAVALPGDSRAGPAIPRGHIPGAHPVLWPSAATGGSGAVHLESRSAHVSPAQAGRKAGRLPRRLAQLFRRRRFSP